jgi:transposase
VVYNPPYSPFANPIEECFSVVKHSFKKARIHKILNKKEVSNEEMIDKAFENVN